MSTNVIQMHLAKPARAQGVFAAVNIAAREMGVSGSLALQYARRARDDYNTGSRSAARVVSDWRATLRAVTERVQA